MMNGRQLSQQDQQRGMRNSTKESLRTLIAWGVIPDPIAGQQTQEHRWRPQWRRQRQLLVYKKK